MIGIVRDHERSRPRQHPVGLTGHGAERLDSMLASPAEWTSPGRSDGYGEDPPAWDGRKVSLLDTDHIWGVGGNPAWVWKSFLRGHNPIFMDPYDHAQLGKGTPDRWNDVRRSLGQTRRLAQQLALARMTPHGELASTRYCLAQPGASYVVYLPEGGKVRVDLSNAPGPFVAEWIDPIEGTVTRSGAVTGGAPRVVKAPGSRPIVLHLRKP